MSSTVPTDETRLVAALTEVLRHQRQAMAEALPELGAGGMPASGELPAWLAPLWQPLLDELARHTARRLADPAAPVPPGLDEQVGALRAEWDALQQDMARSGAALRHAIAQQARQQPTASYGAALPQRHTLGRG